MTPKNGQKIKVLRIISRMNIGGPAVQISSILSMLDESKFEQKLLMGSCDSSELEYEFETQVGTQVRNVPGLGKRENIFRTCYAILILIWEIWVFRPDIVHTHTSKAGLLGRISSIMSLHSHFRVHTYHGHLLSGYFGEFLTKMLVLIEKILANFTDLLVSVGHSVKSDLLQVGIGTHEQYRVIPPGIKFPDLTAREKACASFNVDSESFNVLWIGRLVEIKAPERVCDLARHIMQYNKGIRFIIVGDGPLMSRLKENVRIEKLPITFLGWARDIASTISLADVVLQTSLNEGTPLSLIESQALGVPVLCTNVGSVTEIMQDGSTGFALKYDTTKFVEKILLLQSNKSLKLAMSQKATNFVRANFSRERLVNDHERIYLELMIKPISTP